MKTFLQVVSALVLCTITVSHAASITESNLPSVGALRPTDKLRVNTVEGNSRSILVSDAVTSLGTNGLWNSNTGTNYAQGVTNFFEFIRSSNPKNFPRVHSKIMTNAPIKLL